MLRVCHPTDLSQQGHVAFMHAVRLAASGDGKLTVIHADRPEQAASLEDFPQVRELLGSWRSKRDDAAPELSSFAVEKVEAVGREPLDVVLGYLASHPVDVLVLATEGRTGLDRWRRRSRAEPLARAAGTMTLFVPHHARGFVAPDSGAVALDSILIPVTRDPSPLPAIHAAREMAIALGFPDPRIITCWVGAADDCPLVGLEDTQRLIRQGDDVSEQLLAAAKECHARLIVMTTKGHDGIVDALRGSVTERVLREADCPVLAVPARP